METHLAEVEVVASVRRSDARAFTARVRAHEEAALRAAYEVNRRELLLFDLGGVLAGGTS